MPSRARTLALLRSIAFATSLLFGLAPSAHAQNLRQRISDLFIFGEGQAPLFLAGSGDPNNPASLQAHGEHFIPASSAENSALIATIGDALAFSISSIPIGSTSGSETFEFVGGVPVRTSTSAGPIFAERSLTLGKGRALVGLSSTSFGFSTLRGVDMNDIQLTFTHQNVDFAGCDAVFAGDCTRYGVPAFENDVMSFRLSMDLDVRVTSAYVTYGVNDRLDVGLVLPIVQADFRGESIAQLNPFGGTTSAHFFSGTSAAPVLSVLRQSLGSSSGLGDIAVRAKVNLRESAQTGAAILVDARFPTGSEDDLLGGGKFAGSVQAIVDSHFGSFSPHVNVGYLHHAGERQNDAVLATVGFDQLLRPNVTLAADLVSDLQVGDSKLILPGRSTSRRRFAARSIRRTSPRFATTS